jgi:predicted ABC-type ATPase
MLRSVEQNVERVRVRVANGGHTVPEDKIRERRARSLEQMPWFLEQADWAEIFDNSGATLNRVGIKREGSIQIDPKAPPDLLAALTKTT